MRTLIKRNFPAHGIVGEEYGNERTNAEYVWVLDPIDGTKSFITGMPAWGSLIALTRNGEPVFGMMHQPFIRERFSGDGGAAQYRGPAGARALNVRPCAALGDAMLFTTSPRLMNAADRAAFGTVEQAVKLSRYGGDCYAYCMLAAGPRRSRDRDRPEAARHRGADPDRRRARAASSPTGKAAAPSKGGRVIAAGDKRVHAAALKVLQRITSTDQNSGVPGTNASNAAQNCSR